MKILRSGDSGAEVKKWQAFLFGIGYQLEADGDFGISTATATRNFQSAQKLPADGAVGNQTYAAAARLGFPLVAQNSAYPPKPDFASPSKEVRREILGSFRYDILAGDKIRILDGWAEKNIVKVYVPQLVGIFNAPKDGNIVFHRKGVEQLKALFAAWEAAGVLHYIESWAGTFNPRMIRGSRTNISNHAYGSAFDINAAWNGLGIAPPLPGQKGTVVPLVAIANDHGFYWGGHYNDRKDGMHFELAVLNRFPKKPATVQPSFSDTIAAVVEAANVKLQQQTSSAAAPASIPPTGSPSQPSDAQGFDSPATADYSNANPAQDEPSPINPNDSIPGELITYQPQGDAPNVAPRKWLNVEDWKPFVVRMLKRVWASFGGLVAVYGSGLIFTAQQADYSDWRVWVAIAGIGIAVLLILAMFASLILIFIWYFNRREIVQYKTEEIRALINPEVHNFSLSFEKK